MALAAILTVEFSGRSLALGIAAAVGLGLAVGLLNGFIVTVMHVNSFIATLGTMVAVRGVALLVTDSAPVQGGSIDAALAVIDELFWIFTPKVLILVAALVLIHFMLSRTRTGREFYAVGGNMEAARAAGVPVRWRIVQGFVICGVLSSVAGWISATELNSANPNMAADIALLAIAAVVVGGASLTGGRGTALGTALGALTVALIATVLDLEGISSGYQAIATGLILLLVVAADQLSVLTALGRRLHARLRPAEST
jgi:ribose/xylose/arabinose/galactoside ABC-type transport system permease subunit